ncbi:MAG: sel1 repeat family protein [Proteobacteria bacterium]|nr:sel1 repeat family protein [Pseudomonadota bacterium]
MKKITRFLLICALGLVPALANVSVAEEAWQGPDQLLAAARAGDSEAQLEIGILYEYGFFMADNKAPALAWYGLAAEQGNVKAAKLRDKLQAAMNPAEIQQADAMRPTLSTAPAPVPAPPVPSKPVTPAAPAAAPEAAPEVTAIPAETPAENK